MTAVFILYTQNHSLACRAMFCVWCLRWYFMGMTINCEYAVLSYKYPIFSQLTDQSSETLYLWFPFKLSDALSSILLHNISTLCVRCSIGNNCFESITHWCALVPRFPYISFFWHSLGHLETLLCTISYFLIHVATLSVHCNI